MFISVFQMHVQSFETTTTSDLQTRVGCQKIWLPGVTVSPRPCFSEAYFGLGIKFIGKATLIF